MSSEDMIPNRRSMMTSQECQQAVSPFHRIDASMEAESWVIIATLQVLDDRFLAPTPKRVERLKQIDDFRNWRAP
jgi:hypothetical protein